MIVAIPGGGRRRREDREDGASAIALFKQPCGLVFTVPARSPSRGGDVTVFVNDTNRLSLPTPFYSVLVSVSVLWPFQLYFVPYINSFFNSPSSHSVLLVLSLPYWSFQLYVCLYGSLLQP